MERITIKQLNQHLNQEIVTYFLILEKELRQGARGHYLRMKLADKDGSVSANIWDNAQYFDSHYKIGDVVKVKGQVKDYKGQLQVTVLNIRSTEDRDDIDLNEFIPATTKDVNQLSEALFTYIESIQNNFLKSLLTAIFQDQEFFVKYAKAPAAKSWHHNYLGGLLEHTISVVKICDFAAQNYPVDRDLLLTGALLHDIGKVYEYDVKRSFEFTNVGRLVGHITLGDELITKKAAEINGFPDILLMKLRHLILSHHGEMEKGAVRLPQTIEAIVLHYADNLDAQTIGVKQLMEGATDENAEWTEFDRLNNRFFFLK